MDILFVYSHNEHQTVSNIISWIIHHESTKDVWVVSRPQDVNGFKMIVVNVINLTRYTSNKILFIFLPVLTVESYTHNLLDISFYWLYRQLDCFLWIIALHYKLIRVISVSYLYSTDESTFRLRQSFFVCIF